MPMPAKVAGDARQEGACSNVQSFGCARRGPAAQLRCLRRKKQDKMPIEMGNGKGIKVLVCGAGGFIGVSLSVV